MLARHPLAAVLAALALGLAACGDARPAQQGGGGLCVGCHGTAGRPGALPGTDPNLAAAPPVAPAGEPAAVIGAHQAHLNPPVTGALSGPIACSQCHVVPTDTSHASSPPARIVVFGPLATAPLVAADGTNPGTPTWNSTNKIANTTCSNVYCHGSFSWTGKGQGGANVVGNLANAPDWTLAGQPICGSCHGIPPTNHIVAPSVSTDPRSCHNCHPGTVDANGNIVVDPATGASLHVNGRIDEGAHSDPNWYVNPVLNPTFTPRGGDHILAALDFTAPSAGVAGCLQCHVSYDSPIAANDPNTSCNACHAATVLAGAATSTWQTNCVFCHGDKSKLLTWTASHPASEIAPPRGVGGQTLATDLVVGAHQQHVDAATNVLSSPVACVACHPSPMPADLAHVNGVPEVPLTGTLGAVPIGGTWANPGCSATYCHGNYPQGGNNATPVWTTVNGSFAACTSCHNAPPTTGQHPFHVTDPGGANLNCSDCHSGIATGTRTVAPAIVGKPLHVNGVRNVVFSAAAGATAAWNPAPTVTNAAAGTCSNVACHGGGTRTW